MSEPWVRRTLRALDLGFWVVLAGIWLVVLVLAVIDGDDGWRIFIAVLWLATSSVWLVRTLRSREKRQQEEAERASS
ncbi:hypothetical protein [Blastococcus montanus]|uniref:hypothetical protein n=1 Tax=Blastococcus montanus TaxID=3144973 RepID=UPI0032098EE3